MAPTIGVLTFHRCINYGSYWQARCLVEALRARGHDAVLLDHASRRVKLAEWSCALRPVLPTPVPPSDFPLYRRKIDEFRLVFPRLPLSRPFSLEDPVDMESFDVVVVGSDEVWNLSHPWFGGCPLFYGIGVRAGRLVSYAASFGSYAAWQGLHPWWAEQLRGFAAVSVRDENSRTLVAGATGVRPQLALDPCLQFPLPLPDGGSGDVPADGPFVAVYGHNFTRWFSSAVTRWARSRGYPLLSVGYRNDWADVQWIDAGPHDFARAMARAGAVATNFFHGCVFALRNATPFACELSPYRSNKVRDLLRTVGGEHRLVARHTPDDTVDATLEGPIEPALLQRIDSLRGEADAYLDAALA